ncbi:MAG: HAD-IIA family hydrolase [Clostridia bacterium]|nr:HAD-IIA family hydrolase [Clostridia bacterium]
MNEIAQKKLFLLDMDGTVYFENELIPGAREFIDTLIRTGRDYVFMTNNSSKSAGLYLEKLKKIGLPADETNIFTSGMAASVYIKQQKSSPRIYVVGTSSLRKELSESGIEVSEDGKGEIDFLLVGYDTELEYKKLEIACDILCRGIPFLATNPDVVCPVRNGRYLPDCATICYMLEKATGKAPFYIGKPRREMALCAVDWKGGNADDCAIVGDRIYTDIACGKNADIYSVLVLSGESTRDDIKKYGIIPDLVVNSVKDLTPSLL